jgi:hypothetical protein
MSRSRDVLAIAPPAQEPNSVKVRSQASAFSTLEIRYRFDARFMK